MYILYTYPDFWLKGNKRERPSFERPYTFSYILDGKNKHIHGPHETADSDSRRRARSRADSVESDAPGEQERRNGPSGSSLPGAKSEEERRGGTKGCPKRSQ